VIVLPFFFFGFEAHGWFLVTLSAHPAEAQAAREALLALQACDNSGRGDQDSQAEFFIRVLLL
jgi:hypothetical protein